MLRLFSFACLIVIQNNVSPGLFQQLNKCDENQSLSCANSEIASEWWQTKVKYTLTCTHTHL